MEKIPENFHSISEERKELREALKEIAPIPSAQKAVGKKIEENLNEVDEKASRFKISDFGGLSGAKERLKEDKQKADNEQWIDEISIQGELGEKYDELKRIRDDYDGISAFELKTVRKTKTNSYATKMYESIRNKIVEEKEVLIKEEEEIRRTDPVLVHAADLVRYKKDIHSEGHIAHTPSVEGYIRQIGTRMVNGKPMFLHGPTGTGKTSLARYAAEHFTGEKAEMVYCNPQTRESNIWGKTGIKPTEGGGIETVDIYGPLSRAAQAGKVVIFDEFTALPKEQQVFIKGIFNAKPGDKINVMGNGVVEIKPGFQMIFTANLKSEKNPERQELPPEIAREFEQNNLEVGYTPKEEAYDIILARLSNSDGSLDMSFHDLNVTLPKFLEAMEEVQIAYTDKTDENTARLTGTLDASGKRPGLKKMVFTQGTIEAICEAWQTEKQINSKHKSFAEFLDERLKTALTFKEYPESDRILAAKILSSKGLLRTVTPKELDLPDNIFSFDAAKKLRGAEAAKEISATSAKETHLSLKEVADLDPFHTRVKSATEIAGSFLTEEEKEEMEKEAEAKAESKENLPDIETFLLKTYKNWGVEQTKLDAIHFSAEIAEPKSIDYSAKKSDIDVSKYGEYTMNPETKDIDWETIPANKIKTVQLPSNMEGKSLDEVAKYILATYGNRYKLPGLEYYKYICENPAKALVSLKDGNYHFMFGSLFRHSDGNWSVPYVYGDASGFDRSAAGWTTRGMATAASLFSRLDTGLALLYRFKLSKSLDIL